MGDPGKEEYKIQCFDAETQQLLKTALKGERGEPPEPGSTAPERGPDRRTGMTLGRHHPLPSLSESRSPQHNSGTGRHLGQYLGV